MWAVVKDATSIPALEAFRQQYGKENLVYDRQIDPGTWPSGSARHRLSARTRKRQIVRPTGKLADPANGAVDGAQARAVALPPDHALVIRGRSVCHQDATRYFRFEGAALAPRRG
jgi:hypothetical protein